MLKVITIIGARPQFIKAAAISRCIREQFSDQMEEIIVHTGQHYDRNMSEVFFTELAIPKEKYNLKVGSGSHAAQTAQMMVELEKVIEKEQPDAILMYGDTNSTLAGTLVASKIHLPIIHIEAGVRMFNKDFPEEVNRIICDHLAALLFVPTDYGMDSLKKEGLAHHEGGSNNYNRPGVYKCGDIMYDNTLYFSTKIEGIEARFFKEKGLPRQNYVLATMHRPSNVDQKETLDRVLRAFEHLLVENNRELILPLHPRTAAKLEAFDWLDRVKENQRIHLIAPVSFLEMIALQKHCDLVITDSGGVQKEAYFMKKPSLVMLSETPWPELQESGTSHLVDNDFDKIVNGANDFLSRNENREYPAIYGDGRASEFICKVIMDNFSAAKA